MMSGWTCVAVERSRVVVGVATLAVALSGCGNSPQRAKAQTDAASACQQLDEPGIQHRRQRGSGNGRRPR